MSEAGGTFAFEPVEPDIYAVTHHPTGHEWRFKVEAAQPLQLRSLMPQRTSSTPPSTKANSVIRRSAFQFAVVEARRLGLID